MNPSAVGTDLSLQLADVVFCLVLKSIGKPDMVEIGLGVTFLALIVWLVLLVGWGGFWWCDQRLEGGNRESGVGSRGSEGCGDAETGGRGNAEKYLTANNQPLTTDSTQNSQLKTQNSPLFPSVCVVIPARNEAEVLPVSLRSLLTQNYPGDFQIVLVDDHSTDGTSEVAKKTAEALKNTQKLHVILAEPLPTGWSGKLWAMEQGVRKAQAFSPEYILLTDADIEHDASNLSRLVAKTVEANLDMASVMVRLRCESFWEQLLIPAFVFFFQKLYPFRWVNNPAKRTAGAAGGCILIRHEALERIGGIQAIRQALIDDCSLAEKVKALPGKIWLGLSDQTHSLRPYPSLKTIWNMVARTAYTQLNYNPVLLLGTLVGMTLVYLVPPIAFFVGSITGQWTIAITGLITYLLMTLAYFPTVHFYKVSPAFAFCLPAIAFLYSLMTLDSAVRHWQGRGGAWKGRVYPG